MLHPNLRYQISGLGCLISVVIKIHFGSSSLLSLNLYVLPGPVVRDCVHGFPSIVSINRNFHISYFLFPIPDLCFQDSYFAFQIVGSVPHAHLTRNSRVTRAYLRLPHAWLMRTSHVHHCPCLRR